MKTSVNFVVTGSVFATVEEFLTIVVLKRDIPSYLFTLLVLSPRTRALSTFPAGSSTGSSPVNRVGTTPIP